MQLLGRMSEAPIPGSRDLYRDRPCFFTARAQGAHRGRMRRSPGNKEGAVMRRHTLTIITVLGLATGPSALFTGTALGFAGSPDARDANATALANQNVDLRSPDARDSGRVVVVPQSSTPSTCAPLTPATRPASRRSRRRPSR